MWIYVLRLLCGIALIMGAIFASKLLCIYVRKPLVEFCNKKGFSASPWLIFICFCVGIYRLNIYVQFEMIDTLGQFVDKCVSVKDTNGMINCYGGMALATIPLLICLIRTRLYFIPVLLIKIICIPLDLFYLVHSCLRKDNFEQGTPISKLEYRDGIRYKNVYTNSDGYVAGDSPESERYVEEKYRDQYRASQEADSYHTASSEDGDRYYTGDYVPFVSEGEAGEIRTYDSDYTPMDE